MEITTQRLTIRRFIEADRTDFLAYQTLPEIRTYMADEPMSEERAARFLSEQSSLTGSETGRYHAFAVYHPGASKVIGDVGFYLEPRPEKKGDLGFQFHPTYQGQGYATEAATALIRHGFLELGLHRITSGCDARNLASFRLMERLNMRREAHFKQSRMTRGVWHDEYLYALLRDEWMAQVELTVENSKPYNK